jgi:hypothetical protein
MAESDALISFCLAVNSISGSSTEYFTGVGVAGMGVDVLGSFVGIPSVSWAVGITPVEQAERNKTKINAHIKIRSLIWLWTRMNGACFSNLWFLFIPGSPPISWQQWKGNIEKIINKTS